MASTALRVSWVLVCALLLVSSHVAAAEELKKKGDALVDDNKQLHGCRTGCCGWVRGRCVRCCGASETAVADDATVGENKHHLPPCAKGCCSSFNGHCMRCCAEGEEAPAGLTAEGEPQT